MYILNRQPQVTGILLDPGVHHWIPFAMIRCKPDGFPIRTIICYLTVFLSGARGEFHAWPACSDLFFLHTTLSVYHLVYVGLVAFASLL